MPTTSSSRARARRAGHADAVCEGHLEKLRQAASAEQPTGRRPAQEERRLQHSLGFSLSTNIAAYLWSVLAAERLQLISHRERSRLDGTFTTLEAWNGQWLLLNELDRGRRSSPRSTVRRETAPAAVSPWITPGWQSLWPWSATPSPRSANQRHEVVGTDQFPIFYDPYDAPHPTDHPAQLHDGYWADERFSPAITECLIQRPELPAISASPEASFRPSITTGCYRTLPRARWQSRTEASRTDWRKLWSQGIRGSSITGGRESCRAGRQHVRGPDGHAFVPETVWAPRSWGGNHPLYVAGQDRARTEEVSTVTGDSLRPQVPRRIQGLRSQGLGTCPIGYFCFEIAALSRPSDSSAGGYDPFGVVTPHASFLALRYAPHEAIANCGPGDRLPDLHLPGFPGLGGRLGRGGRGLHPDSGSGNDHGGDRQCPGRRRHPAHLQRWGHRTEVRPLIAMEEFSTGPPGQVRGDQACRQWWRPQSPAARECSLTRGSLDERAGRQTTPSRSRYHCRSKSWPCVFQALFSTSRRQPPWPSPPLPR